MRMFMMLPALLLTAPGALAGQTAAQNQPVVQIGVFSYRADGTPSGSAFGTAESNPSTVFASASLCQMGAGYRDLAAGLRAAILRGDVPAGTRLPPQRELADLLSIGRTTVVGAYNLLCAESLLEMRQGAGTWVARDRRSQHGRPVRS